MVARNVYLLTPTPDLVVRRCASLEQVRQARLAIMCYTPEAVASSTAAGLPIEVMWSPLRRKVTSSTGCLSYSGTSAIRVNGSVNKPRSRLHLIKPTGRTPECLLRTALNGDRRALSSRVWGRVCCSMHQCWGWPASPCRPAQQYQHFFSLQYSELRCGKLPLQDVAQLQHIPNVDAEVQGELNAIAPRSWGHGRPSRLTAGVIRHHIWQHKCPCE